MGLCDDVRGHCARVAAHARFVTIDERAIGQIGAGPEPGLDPEIHFLDGSPADVATYVMTLDTINFGSGWFPTLRKPEGRSGYATVAAALAERFRSEGPWSARELRALDAGAVAGVLGQDPRHDLMGLYARALRQLGRFLGERTALDVVEAADRSAQRLAALLARGMPFFDDRGFYKRAQIAASDLALAGVARFDDLDRLTIFADNVVPHVLRVDGVLIYDDTLAVQIDAGDPLPPGAAEREIRACAVHACEAVARELSAPPRVVDGWLWNRGREPRYKARPRHRTRTVYY